MSATIECPASEQELDELLSRPTELAVDALRKCPGDVVILGAGGKMGPTLARMCRRTVDNLGDGRRVVAVSRFGRGDTAKQLQSAGVETIACDLLDRRAMDRLPDAPNVIFMAGQKFGTADSPASTWAMNTIVPAYAAERYPKSRIVVFSSGNVYPLTSVAAGGSRESDPIGPVGEYAQSCVGRERVFEYFTARNGTPVATYRLNYAIDLRYGVLTDIAVKVFRGEPVDVTMGYVNLIWQGDANARAIACLPLAASPPTVWNVTGLQTLSVRELAEAFGKRFGKAPQIVGQEAGDALLSNAGKSAAAFGNPETSLAMMLDLTAQWIQQGRPLLGKPTHFDTRNGAF